MDKAFFTREIEARADTMYRVAYSILRCDADCKDAMQDAALKAWEKRLTLKDETRFAAWLTRILINACYDLRRKRRPTVPLELTVEPSSPPPDPALALALEGLPEKLRLPLVLRYAEGMDEKEIARALRLPPSTVRGRLHRAKLQLRKELEA